MEQYLGQILMVGFNFAPQGWALCNGQMMSIAQNSALFALLGTNYGGDGVSTFALPNLQGSVPVHQGQGPRTSPYVLGQVGGSESATLSLNNMPAHTHPANCSDGLGVNSSPVNGIWAQANPGGRDPVATPSYATTADKQMAQTAIGLAGGNQPLPIVQPYLCVNFIIALSGIFPPRS